MRIVDLSKISTKKIHSLSSKKLKMSLACRRKEMDEIIMSYMEEGGSSSEDVSDSEAIAKSKKVCNLNKGYDSGASPSSMQYSARSVQYSASSVQYTTPSTGKCTIPYRKFVTPPKKRILEENRLAAQSYEAAAAAASASAAAEETKPSIPVPPKKRPIKMPVRKCDPSPVRHQQQSLEEDENFARQLQAEEFNFRQRISKAVPKKADQNGQPMKRKRNVNLSWSIFEELQIIKQFNSSSQNKPDVPLRCR